MLVFNRLPRLALAWDSVRIQALNSSIQKIHTPVIHVHGQLDTMHTHSHTTMHAYTCWDYIQVT
jgi:sensor domain CHASE-containing protein